MPATESEVVVGAIFLTPTNEVRKVFEVSQDENGTTRIYWQGKSKNFPLRSFGGGPNRSGPTRMDTFLGACGRRLTPAEIASFRVDEDPSDVPPALRPS